MYSIKKNNKNCCQVRIKKEGLMWHLVYLEYI
jgi:hypothetical protein